MNWTPVLVDGDTIGIADFTQDFAGNAVDLRPMKESRGLLPLAIPDAKQLECDDREKLRSLCLKEYASLSAEAGKNFAATELGRRHSNLYRRILRHWGGMRAFRVDANSPATRSGSREKTEKNLKSRCLREYEELAKKLSYDPNTTDLVRENESGLKERIVKAWGSFPAFCADQRPQLSRQRKDPRRSIETKRADCIAEYRVISAKLGYNPTVQELKSGICKSVLKCWPTFTAFYDEAGIVTRRPVRRFLSDEDRRSHCIESYSIIMRQLGHAPSSVELARVDVALHGLIVRAFGSFAKFVAKQSAENHALLAYLVERRRTARHQHSRRPHH